ncbi:MAG: cytochrome c biogenesis protein ResB, partial [Chloroflexi bacterium]|nr:cytochrome c biogenesis protein ResB [Chloroflexota bacterium]
MRVALAVILALAVLGSVGTVLVQAPASALADPGAKADWLEGVRPRYGALTGFLDQLGLFAVFDSLLFRALVAFLAASLVACVVHRTRRFWRASVRPGARATPGFFGEAPRRETMTGGH